MLNAATLAASAAAAASQHAKTPEGAADTEQSTRRQSEAAASFVLGAPASTSTEPTPPAPAAVAPLAPVAPLGETPTASGEIATTAALWAVLSPFARPAVAAVGAPPSAVAVAAECEAPPTNGTPPLHFSFSSFLVDEPGPPASFPAAATDAPAAASASGAPISSAAGPGSKTVGAAAVTDATVTDAAIPVISSTGEPLHTPNLSAATAATSARPLQPTVTVGGVRPGCGVLPTPPVVIGTAGSPMVAPRAALQATQSVHPRNKGIMCKLHAETHGSCPVANCPYAHVAFDLELPLPTAMCRFHRTKACLRNGCTMFHGSQQQLAGLNASGAATYRPADLLPQRDPLEPLSEEELVEAMKDRGLHLPPAPVPVPTFRHGALPLTPPVSPPFGAAAPPPPPTPSLGFAPAGPPHAFLPYTTPPTTPCVTPPLPPAASPLFLAASASGVLAGGAAAVPAGGLYGGMPFLGLPAQAAAMAGGPVGVMPSPAAAQMFGACLPVGAPPALLYPLDGAPVAGAAVVPSAGSGPATHAVRGANRSGGYASSDAAAGQDWAAAGQDWAAVAATEQQRQLGLQAGLQQQYHRQLLGPGQA